MAGTASRIRMDDSLMEQFDALCADLGMTASTAITAFAKAFVRERRIPFTISSPQPRLTRNDGLSAFLALRNEAQQNDIQDMTLDEINAEITEVHDKS